MSSFNNIFPGFPWAQTFRFPAGVFAVGEGLRADFRRNPASPVLFSVHSGAGGGVSSAGNDYTVSLTGAQTLLCVGLSKVSFDLVIDGIVDRHLGLRVHVPVTKSLTNA